MKSDAAGRMRLLFVGDVMLGRMVNDFLRRVDADYPWGDTMTQLQAADWRACNLECVISDRGRPWSRTPKVFHFRSDAKNVAVLRAAGIDAVSLANNHALDFGYDAMLDMLKVLDVAGIQHAGAGTNPAEAVRPGVSVVKGTSIGLIAFTDNEPEWEAGPQSPGLFYLPIESATIALLDCSRRCARRANGTIWLSFPRAGARTGATNRSPRTCASAMR